MRSATLAVQPALTFVIALLQALLEITDLVDPSPLPFDLVVGVPLLLVSLLLYAYTPVILVALLAELRSVDLRAHTLRWLAAGIALVLQGSYLVWPVYRVLGPGRFEEVLFTVDDLLVLVPAGLAVLVVLYLRGSMTESTRLVSD